MFAYMKVGPAEKWLMTIGWDRFVDMDQVSEVDGKVCEVFPASCSNEPNVLLPAEISSNCNKIISTSWGLSALYIGHSNYMYEGMWKTVQQSIGM